jgi:hypothetical protein
LIGVEVVRLRGPAYRHGLVDRGNGDQAHLREPRDGVHATLEYVSPVSEVTAKGKHDRPFAVPGAHRHERAAAR